MKNHEHNRAARRDIGLGFGPMKMLLQRQLASVVQVQPMTLVSEPFGRLPVAMSLDLLLVVATMAAASGTTTKTDHALYPCPPHFRET